MKKNKTKEIHPTNSIEATYIVESNKTISFFNYDKVGIKNEDYKIEELDFVPNDKNSLRSLKDIVIDNGEYTPSKSEILKIKIVFNIHLNTLDNIFKGKTELIEVNLVDFEMKDVKSMKNSFSGCSNLKVINFDKINSSNLENMENTFENCTELKSLNLSSFNTTNLKTANSLFSGCSKLEDLNIASFKNIDDNLFNGIN